MQSTIPKTLLLIAGLTLACVSSCALLNTFYNAQVAFDSAYREHKKQMRQYPDSILAPTGTALTNYDRAIEKSGKVLQVYPKDKRWLDDATFLMGKAYFYKGELNKAIRRFLDLQAEYPGSPFIPESYLLLGHAYLLNGDLPKAEETLNLVIDKYPQLNKNEDVSMLLAQIAIRRQGKVMAIELLDNIRKSVHSDEKKIELIIQTAAIYADLQQFGRAAQLLREAPRRPKLTNQMYRIDMLLLACCIGMDSLEEARRLADVMLKTRDYDMHTSPILLKKATVLDREKKFDGALELYDRVARGADSTTDMAGESWFAMAVIYQMAKGDLQEAKKYYQKAVPRLKDSVHIDLANRRIKALDAIDAFAKGTAPKPVVPQASGTTAPPPPTDKRFTIGELFWLELDEPDSAYRHFKDVVADTSLDTEMRTKALYAEGYLQLNAFKDTAQADTIFNRLVLEYPSNKYSRRAQEDRGRTVTVKTTEDSAWEAFDLAEKTFFDQDSAVSGARAYLDVHNRYPGTEAGAKGLFTAAWICDNVLFKKKAAKSLYEKVCSEYANSTYCVNQVKPRLKIVADSLNARKVRGGRAARGTGKDATASPAGAGTANAKLAPSKPEAPQPSARDTAAAVPPDSSAKGSDQLDIPDDTDK